MKRIICILLTALLLVNGILVFGEEESYVFFAENCTIDYNTEGSMVVGIKGNKGFAAYTMEVYYDSEVLELVSCVKAESEDSAYAEGFISINAETPGTIRSVFASTSNVVSDIDLLNLSFKAVKLPEEGVSTPVSLKIEFLDDEVWSDDTLSALAQTESGEVTIKALSDLNIIVAEGTEYIENQELDLTKISVEAVYNNGEMRLLESTEYEISGYSTPLKAWEIPVVKYTENGITINKETGITVREKKIIGIRADSSAVITSYKEDDLLDLTGLKVYKLYDNGEETEAEKTEYTVDKENIPLKATDTSFMIIYNEDEAFTVNVEITVKRKKPESIRLENVPENIIVRLNQGFYAEGLKVIAVYEDGAEEEITDYETEGLDGTYGDKTVFIVKEGVKSEGLAVRVVVSGDATFNGKVQPNDAAAVLKHIVGLKLLEEHAFVAANVYREGGITGDRKVLNPSDAIMILKYCAGYEMELK